MTQSARDYLASEIKRIAHAMTSITSEAEAANRSLTAEETQKVNEMLADVRAMKVRITEMDDRDALKKSIQELEGNIASDAPAEIVEAPKSVGEGFVRSQAYKALRERGLSGRWTTGPIEFGAKLTDAGLSVESTDLAGGALPLQPQVARGPLEPVEEPLELAVLFGQGVATQNSIVYLEETTTQTLLGQNPYSGSSSSDVHITPGTAKPPVFVDFTKRSTSIEKIAAFLPVADEMLEDEPQISSYINGRLQVFVRQAEEAYLLNKLLSSGVSTASAATDLGGNNLFDAIAAGILKVQVNGGLNPDAVLINPTDFWRMATTKAGTTGDYFSGGPYANPLQNPWGIKAVITREAPINKPVVGAFREGATLWRKGGLSVEASNSHADYFRKDLTALRAEERLGLTVFRPKAFCLCTVA